MNNDNTKLREFNKIIDDPCAIQQRNNDNSKKFKFITTNHIDLLNAKTDYNFFGMALRDQLFVPGENMDTYSSLIQGTSGNINTNCNVKNGFGQLPLNIPSRYQTAHGNIGLESNFRHLSESNRKTLNPKDSNFHDRYFTLFDNVQGVEVEAPKALNSVENWQRAGISSRFFKQL